MFSFINLTEKEKKEALLVAEAKSGLPAYVIEKDFWVSLILYIVYEKIRKMNPYTLEPFIFKGGTSLSKCYKLIHRMSEDIDLSFSFELLKCQPIDPNGKSKGCIKKESCNIDNAAEKYIKECFIVFMKNELDSLGIKSFNLTTDDSLNIEFFYPRALSEDSYGTGYVKPRVLIETGGRSANDPIEHVNITHILGEHIQELQDDSFEVVALSPKRTILEKMFATHRAIYRQNVDCVRNIIPEKYSRHLYDIVQINRTHPDYCIDKALFMSVVDFCRIYFSTSDDVHNSLQSGPILLNPINESAIEQYANDWESMKDMFPNGELPVDFKQLMQDIKSIADRACSVIYQTT